MFYVGLDWHQRTSSICILNDHGKTVQQFKQPGHWRKTVERLAQFQRDADQPITLCMEASGGYGPLHDELQTLAQDVVVAHPGQTRLIFRSHRKNDRIDAAKLAKLLFLDQVPRVHVPSIDVRGWRQLIEFRRTQVDQRTRVKNQIRGHLRNHGLAALKSGNWLWTQAGRDWFQHLTWSSDTAKHMAMMLRLQLDQAEQAVKQITQQLDELLKKHSGASLLQTIPGVGPRTAEVALAYIDDMGRFARLNRLGAYFGLVPKQDASGGTNRLGHITKQGPATARRLLVEAAWQLIRRDDSARAMFERVHQGKKDRRKIALIAVAHKLVRTIGSMLRSGEVWRTNGWGGVSAPPPPVAGVAAAGPKVVVAWDTCTDT